MFISDYNSVLKIGALFFIGGRVGVGYVGEGVEVGSGTYSPYIITWKVKSLLEFGRYLTAMT